MLSKWHRGLEEFAGVFRLEPLMGQGSYFWLGIGQWRCELLKLGSSYRSQLYNSNEFPMFNAIWGEEEGQVPGVLTAADDN
jgi:hypothetical protein